MDKLPKFLAWKIGILAYLLSFRICPFLCDSSEIPGDLAALPACPPHPGASVTGLDVDLEQRGSLFFLLILTSNSF